MRKHENERGDGAKQTSLLPIAKAVLQIAKAVPKKEQLDPSIAAQAAGNSAWSFAHAMTGHADSCASRTKRSGLGSSVLSGPSGFASGTCFRRIREHPRGVL